MGSQTTVLQRLRRLLAKRQNEENALPIDPIDDPVATAPKSRASSGEFIANSREASPEQADPPTPVANPSNTSLELRRRVSFGSLSSRGAATSTPATEESGEHRDATNALSSQPMPATSLNGNTVVRMDPKVYLLRNKHTDAASILTIASSSKRRRRSLDTNASTRALAAESMFSSDAGSVTSN